MPLKRVCVYCGSVKGIDERFAQAARTLGHLLAERSITLVYGGGRIGLMGALADAVLERGGEVIGIIPEKLYSKETAHEGISELMVVEGMHARKNLMTHLANAFIAMPGGWGTFEELFEMSAWRQLRFHQKPIGLLNTAGYYDALLTFLDGAEKQGFVRPGAHTLWSVEAEPAALLDLLSEA